MNDKGICYFKNGKLQFLFRRNALTRQKGIQQNLYNP